MSKFCVWAGMICLVAAIVLTFETNLLTGLMIVPGALVLLVLAKHLDNQEKIIEAINDTACPQLYYIRKFAPSLVRDVVVKDSPEYAGADITISEPRLTSGAYFRIKGRASRKGGMIVHSADFVIEFGPGEYYQRSSLDWQLIHFEWV